MFYVKIQEEGLTVKATITDENVFTDCPVCGKQIQADLYDILQDGDLFSTSIYCKECYEK